MRIEAIHIDGFGVFHDACLRDLSPRLTVFHGPNESGKSTLLAFLRFVFFGFPDKRKKANRYPPLRAGSAHGGSVVLADGEERFLLQRHDRLQLTKPDGDAGEEADLHRLLGSLDRETFRNVFAFSLGELQQLHDAFDQGAIQNALWGASGAMKHQVLADAGRYLQENLDRLFKPKSKRAALNSALSELEDVQQQIRQAEIDLEAFDRLGKEVAGLEEDLARTRERQREIQGEIQRLEELAGRLENRRQRQLAFEQVLAKRDSVRGERDAIRLDPALVKLSAEIQELERGRHLLVALRREKPLLAETLETSRRDVALLLAALGAGWTPERVGAVRAQAGLRDEAAVQAEELQKADLEAAQARAAEGTAMAGRDTAQEQEKQAAAALEALPEPPPPPEASLLERVTGGRGDYERSTRDIRAREGDLRAAEEEFRRSLAEIDPRWTEPDLQRFDTSYAANQELQRFRNRLGEAAQEVERARNQGAQAQADAAKADERRRLLQEKLAALPLPPCDAATLTEWRDRQRRLALRWAAAPGQAGPVWAPAPVAVAGTIRETTYHRRVMPSWAPVVVAIAGLGAGVALGLLQPVAGVLLAAGSVAAAIALWRVGRRRRTAYSALQAEFASLCRSLGRERPLTGDSLLELERALDAAADALRQGQSLSEQLQQADGDAAAVGQALARRQAASRDAATELEREQEAWRRHLESIGLPATLSPESAVAVISRIELARERLEKVRALRHRIEAMERNRQEYLAVVAELLAGRGQPPVTHADFSVRLPQLLESLRAENEARARRQEAVRFYRHAAGQRRPAEETWLQAAGAHQRAMEKLQNLTVAWREWLVRNDLPYHLSPATAGGFLVAVDRAAELLDRIGDVEQQLRRSTEQERSLVGRLHEVLFSLGRPASADPVSDLDGLAAALQAAEKDDQNAALLDARVAEMDLQVGAMGEELRDADQRISLLRRSESEDGLEIQRRHEELELEAHEQQRRLLEGRSRHQAMATDERLSKLLEQKEARLETAREAAKQWAALALARHLFDEARGRYERERQPAVLKLASVHLRKLTGGRYREVRMPLDGSALQALPAGDAPAKTADQLSRGAAEQLYLALRFGFIEEFTRDRRSLPLVLDDILVNFDPERAAATIATLVELSERFQILYFTCHPETADRFKAFDSAIPVFRLRDGCFVSSAAGT